MGCDNSKEGRKENKQLESLESLESHKAAMDAYLSKMGESQIDNSEGFKADAEEIDKKIAKLKAKMAAGEIDQEAYNKKLAKKYDKNFNPEKETQKIKDELKKKTRESQLANVSKLWIEFDENGDGVLDKEENRKLVKNFFQSGKTNFPKILKTHLDVSLATYMKVVKAKIYTKMDKEEKGKPDSVLHALMDGYMDTIESNRQKDNDKLLEKVMGKVVEELEKMEKQSEKIADELLVKMDLDNDGSVVRHEFEQSFCELMDQVFDVTAIADPIIAMAEKEVEKDMNDMAAKAKEANKRHMETLAKHRAAMDGFLSKMEMEEKQHHTTDQFKVDAEEIDKKIAKLKAKMEAGEIDEETYNKKLEKKFDKTINPEKETQKVNEELKKKTKEAMLSNISKLWDDFEENGDGLLSKEENRRLVSLFLESGKTNYKKILKLHLDMRLATYMKVVKAKIYTKMEKEQEGGKPDFMLRALMDTYMDTIEADQEKDNEKLLDKVMVQVVEEIEKMEKESDTIADELLVKMDLNNDGNVTREEFEQSFIELMDQVFDVTAIAHPVVAMAEKEVEQEMTQMAEEAKEGSKRFKQKASRDAKEKSEAVHHA